MSIFWKNDLNTQKFKHITPMVLNRMKSYKLKAMEGHDFFKNVLQNLQLSLNLEKNKVKMSLENAISMRDIHDRQYMVLQSEMKKIEKAIYLYEEYMTNECYNTCNETWDYLKNVGRDELRAQKQNILKLNKDLMLNRESVWEEMKSLHQMMMFLNEEELKRNQRISEFVAAKSTNFFLDQMMFKNLFDEIVKELTEKQSKKMELEIFLKEIEEGESETLHKNNRGLTLKVEKYGCTFDFMLKHGIQKGKNLQIYNDIIHIFESGPISFFNTLKSTFYAHQLELQIVTLQNCQARLEQEKLLYSQILNHDAGLVNAHKDLDNLNVFQSTNCSSFSDIPKHFTSTEHLDSTLGRQVMFSGGANTHKMDVKISAPEELQINQLDSTIPSCSSSTSTIASSALPIYTTASMIPAKELSKSPLNKKFVHDLGSGSKVNTHITSVLEVTPTTSVYKYPSKNFKLAVDTSETSKSSSLAFKLSHLDPALPIQDSMISSGLLNDLVKEDSSPLSSNHEKEIAYYELLPVGQSWKPFPNKVLPQIVNDNTFKSLPDSNNTKQEKDLCTLDIHHLLDHLFEDNSFDKSEDAALAGATCKLETQPPSSENKIKEKKYDDENNGSINVKNQEHDWQEETIDQHTSNLSKHPLIMKKRDVLFAKMQQAIDSLNENLALTNIKLIEMNNENKDLKATLNTLVQSMQPSIPFTVNNFQGTEGYSIGHDLSKERHDIEQITPVNLSLNTQLRKKNNIVFLKLKCFVSGMYADLMSRHFVKCIECLLKEKEMVTPEMIMLMIKGLEMKRPFPSESLYHDSGEEIGCSLKKYISDILKTESNEWNIDVNFFMWLKDSDVENINNKIRDVPLEILLNDSRPLYQLLS